MTELSSIPLDSGSAVCTAEPAVGLSAFLASVNARSDGPEQWEAPCPDCGGHLAIVIHDDPWVGRPAVHTRCLTAGCETWTAEQLAAIVVEPIGVDWASLQLFSDVGRSHVLHALLRQRDFSVRWSPSFGYYLWNGERWVRDQRGEILHGFAHQIGTAMAKHSDELALAAAQTSDKARAREWQDQSNRLGSAAIKAQASKAIENAVKELRRHDGVPLDDDEGFDENAHLLGVANGVVDLRTGKLLPNTPDLLVSRSLAVEYHPDAVAPRWKRHLEEVLPGQDEIDWLQRWFGYSATGHTDEGKLPIFLGEGRNGKGAITETIQHVFDEVAYETSFATFCTQRNGTNLNSVAQFAHARMVFASEAAAAYTMDAAGIKALTGGNRVAAMFKYHDEFSFKPQFKITLSTNEMPKVHDTSVGFWERLLVLRFPHSFLAENADTSLKPTLLTEAEGVLAWCVAGAVEWAKHGLGETQSMRDETKSFQESSDVLGEFFNTCTVRDPDATVMLKDTFSAFLDWCAEENIQHPITRKTFSLQAAKRQGVLLTANNKNVKMFRGLRLAVPADRAALNPISKETK